jgi:hypothetical protein
MIESLKKIDEKLLLKHPIIWNTKVVWLIGVSVIFHLLFFIAGFIYLSDLSVLQSRRRIQSFVEDGPMVFGIILSIVTIVLWLIYLFKNNALKGFYPSTPLKVFKELILYFVIIFFNISYYYSYTGGMQLSLLASQSKAEVQTEVDQVNRAKGFLPFNYFDYDIKHLIYPEPFDSLFCITEPGKIDREKKYYTLVVGDLVREYQFVSYNHIDYTRNEMRWLQDIEERKGKRFLGQNSIDESIIRYFYADKVHEVALPSGSTKPSYLNYSERPVDTALIDRSSSSGLYFTPYDDNLREYLRKLTSYEKELIHFHQNILLSSDRTQLTHFLTELLDISNKYKVAHNLSLDNIPLLKDFSYPYEISELINNGDKPLNRETIAGDPGLYDNELKSTFSFYGSLYFDMNSLKNVYANYKDFQELNVFEGSTTLFLWLSFILSTLLFCARMTSPKAVLLACVGIGLILLISFTVSIFLELGISDITFYLLALFGLIILLLTLTSLSKFSKRISEILLNITMIGFVPWVFMILLMIEKYQREDCYARDIQYPNCVTILDSFELVLYSLLVLGLLFYLIMAGKVLYWRALPEK